MAYLTKVTIKGQITIPKIMRDILNSRVVQLELNENNNVVVSPARNAGGALRKYSKTYIPLGDIRNSVWEEVAKDRVSGNAN